MTISLPRTIIIKQMQGGGTVRRTIFFISIFIFLFSTYIVAWGSDRRYHIGPGDVLEISIWKDETLSRNVIVPPDGIISFPLIGEINTKNLAVVNLRDQIKSMLSEYIPEVTVTVMLSEINSLKAYVIGKVNSPGEFPITLDTNVMQILSMAGGLNPFASPGKIIILRKMSDTTIKIQFNYKEVENGVNYEQNILLKRGDVIVVP